MIFLRPYWLILLLVPCLFLWLQRKGKKDNPWQKYISPALMPYLSVSVKTGGRQTRIHWLIAFIWCLSTIALSGPAFDKLPTPAVDESVATVLIVDLNTLNSEKTKYLHIKLYDLIRQLGDNQIGLVLYDTKGYIALPLTRDKEMLNTLIPSLEPSVMPSIGNDVFQGFQKADALFRNTNQKTGRILLITGGTPDISSTVSAIRQMPYTIGILGIGDEETGSPVMTRNGSFLRDSSGHLVLSKPEATVLSQLGIYRTATPNGAEISELIQETKPANIPFLQTNLPDFMSASVKADVWRDLGIYLVCMALPFLALLFRKGLFFIGLIVLTMNHTSPAVAGLWLRPDQESYRQIESANEAYRQKDYQKALSIYEKETNLEALYNKANTLAQVGHYQEAIETYNTLLKQMPQHTDGAYNKEYLEKQLQKQQNQSNQTQSEQNQSSDRNDTSSNNKPDNNNHSNQQQNQEESPSSDSSEQNNNKNHHSDNIDRSQNNQTSAEKFSDNADTLQNQSDNSQTESKQKISEQEKPQTNDSDKMDNNTSGGLSTPQFSDSPDNPSHSSHSFEEIEKSDMRDQETQQIINRLKKDPSRVLRYRLYQQYQGN